MASLAAESDVTDSTSSCMSDRSLSDEDSVAVDGSYSCLSGEDERRCFMNAGVNVGRAPVLKPSEVGLALLRGFEAVFVLPRDMFSAGSVELRFVGVGIVSS